MRTSTIAAAAVAATGAMAKPRYLMYFDSYVLLLQSLLVMILEDTCTYTLLDGTRQICLITL